MFVLTHHDYLKRISKLREHALINYAVLLGTQFTQLLTTTSHQTGGGGGGGLFGAILQVFWVSHSPEQIKISRENAF